MKVTLDLDKHMCLVERTPGDPTFRTGGWGEGTATGPTLAESTFLHHVKKELIKQGYDVIKKRMWKDGHLVDDRQQYIRTRKWTNEKTREQFCILNDHWAIWDAGEKFNQDGRVELAVRWDW